MPHILDSQHRTEFFSSPGLVRLTMADGSEGVEATCLFKATTLTLKYCISSAKTELILIRLSSNRLAYGIRVYDDPYSPLVHWSVLETKKELESLTNILKGRPCQAFLFNELVVNVAGGEFLLKSSKKIDSLDLFDIDLGKVIQDSYADEVSCQLRKLEAEEHLPGEVISFDITMSQPPPVSG